MLVIKDFNEFRDAGRAGPPAVTIGNFDGCHLGHQALINLTVNEARRLDGPAVGVTFSPRPDAFFRGTTQETLLFTNEQKTRALAESGLDVQIRKAFDEPFSKLTADAFYDECLHLGLGTRALIVGDNFRFGCGRTGDGAYLAKRGRDDGMTVEVGAAVSFAGDRISSTRIRGALAQGRVDDVRAMLGRPYMVEGMIRRGDQLGRTLGVPTANLEETGQILPAFGVYAGYVWLAPQPDAAPVVMRRPATAVPAVYSIGIRPTLDVAAPPIRIEAHILTGDYALDSLYGLRAGYYFTHRLREERKLDGLGALKDQMAKDIAVARKLLGL